MLTEAVESYLAIRGTLGFKLRSQANFLRSFAIFSDTRGTDYVCTKTAIEWAGSARSVLQRARRIGEVIRFAQYARAEDERHEIPPAVFGRETAQRPVPFIFCRDDIRRIVEAASQLGRPGSLRRYTYSTLFGLMSCTGLRTSEAIHLLFEDVTPDGLVIRCSKFRKSRLIPLHKTARTALERYIERRRPYAPLDDHVFVSMWRRPLLVQDVDIAFRTVIDKIGLPHGPGLPRPTPHSLRHTFAVRALEACPDGRDSVTKHMLALSTYLGHSTVASTYWYLEATPDLMRNIAEVCESFSAGGRP